MLVFLSRFDSEDYYFIFYFNPRAKKKTRCIRYELVCVRVSSDCCCWAKLMYGQVL